MDVFGVERAQHNRAGRLRWKLRWWLRIKVFGIRHAAIMRMAVALIICAKNLCCEFYRLISQ